MRFTDASVAITFSATASGIERTPEVFEEFSLHDQTLAETIRKIKF
jgi:hypothetical protein